MRTYYTYNAKEKLSIAYALWLEQNEPTINKNLQVTGGVRPIISRKSMFIEFKIKMYQKVYTKLTCID